MCVLLIFSLSLSLSLTLCRSVCLFLTAKNGLSVSITRPAGGHEMGNVDIEIAREIPHHVRKNGMPGPGPPEKCCTTYQSTI